MRVRDLKCRHLRVEQILTHAGGTPTLGDLGVTESEVLNGVTAGDVTASKAVVVDTNKDIGDFRNVDVVNLDAGASGTAGTVDVFPTTATSGKLVIACADQDADTAVTITALGMGQATAVNIPDPGASTANFLLTSAANDQSLVTATAAKINATDITTPGVVEASKAVVVSADKDAGDFRNLGCVNLDAGASGAAGSVDVFPTTATSGKLVIACADQDADTAVTVTALGMGQATAVNIPDPGAATGYVVLSSQANDQSIVTATNAQLSSLRRNPGTMAMAFIDFNTGAGEAGMAVTINGVVYQEADAEDFPNGVWTNGASQADSATSLIAAINGDTRAAVPFTAVADTSGDGVMLFWDSVGTAGNVTISTTSAGNCTVQNSTGGAAAAIKQTCTIVHTVNTQELLSGAVEIPVPFTPTHVQLTAYTSAGVPIALTNQMTIGTAPARIILTTAGVTALANTDVVHLTVTE